LTAGSLVGAHCGAVTEGLKINEIDEPKLDRYASSAQFNYELANPCVVEILRASRPSL
jgi:hypothetical protein